MWLLTLLSVSIVLGTVLLSNDMQHLKAIARRFDIELFPKPPTAPPEPQRTYRPKMTDITLPPSLFSEGSPDHAGRLYWIRQTYGPALCDRLRDSGVPMGDWSETAFNAETFECVYEEVNRDAADQLVNSRFLVVRGDRGGAVTTIRIKLVSPPHDATGRLDRSVMQMFETVLDEPHWPDFTDARNAILTLDDYKNEGSGIAILFSQEPSRPGSFNMTLTLTTDVAPFKRPYANRRSLNLDETQLPPPIAEDGLTRFPFLNGWIPRPCITKAEGRVMRNCVNPAPRRS